MFKLCNKCGYMYDDSVTKTCPNCNNDEGVSSQSNNTTEPNNFNSANSNVSNNDFGAVNSGSGVPDFSFSNTQTARQEDEESVVDVVKNTVSEKVLPTLKEKVLPFVSKHKKYFIVAAGVLAVVIIVSIVASSISKNSPVKVSADDFVSDEVFTQDEVNAYYESNSDYGDYYYDYDAIYSNQPYGAGLIVYGYDDAAYVETENLYNIFDWKSLTEDFNEKLSKKQKSDRWMMTFNDVFSDEGSIQIALSDESFEKNGKFKNGDVIEIEYTFTPSYSSEDIKIEPCSGTVKFTVDGLEKVDIFDPFSYVNFTQSGANTAGTAKLYVSEGLNEALPGLDGFSVTCYDENTIALVHNDYIIGKIDFSFENGRSEHSGNFSNGDEVTMRCSAIDNLTEEYGLYISMYSKAYKFDSLGEFLNKSSTIKTEDMDKFKANAEAVLKERFDGNDSFSNISFNTAYLADPKDLTVYNSMSNGLCLIYSYTYTGWGSQEGETKYMYVSYEDLVADKDGAITQTAEEYYDHYNYGYDTVQDILDRVFGTNYNVVGLN